MVLLYSAFLCGFLIICQNVYTTLGSGFCYREDQDCSPSHWHGECQTGKHQSPIDINLNILKLLIPTRTDLHLSRDYLGEQDFIVKNNGHTVQVQFEADQTSRLTLAGDLLQNSYTFAQLHFHWGPTDKGSEHSVNNVKYAMEGHLVHYRSDFDNVTHAVASNKPDALAVVGVMFKLGDNDNPALEPIIKALDSIRSAGSETKGSGLVLEEFLRVGLLNTASIAQYDGSLTTPDCNEVVLWNVFTAPQYISYQQLSHLRSIKDDSGEALADNDRPIQPINDRKIRYHLATVHIVGKGII